MRKTRKVPTVDIEPPSHLSERAAALWRSVVPSRCRSAGRLALVQEALRALDRADMASRELEKVGLTSTTKSSGAIHAHPLIKVEREARQQFAKIWSDQLHLAWDSYIDGAKLPWEADNDK